VRWAYNLFLLNDRSFALCVYLHAYAVEKGVAEPTVTKHSLISSKQVTGSLSSLYLSSPSETRDTNVSLSFDAGLVVSRSSPAAVFARLCFFRIVQKVSFPRLEEFFTVQEQKVGDET
jgi:hypothetical protein